MLLRVAGLRTPLFLRSICISSEPLLLPVRRPFIDLSIISSKDMPSFTAPPSAMGDDLLCAAFVNSVDYGYVLFQNVLMWKPECMQVGSDAGTKRGQTDAQADYSGIADASADLRLPRLRLLLGGFALLTLVGDKPVSFHLLRCVDMYFVFQHGLYEGHARWPA